MERMGKLYSMRIDNLTEDEIEIIDSEWKKFSEFVDCFESKRNLEITRTK